MRRARRAVHQPNHKSNPIAVGWLESALSLDVCNVWMMLKVRKRKEENKYAAHRTCLRWSANRTNSRTVRGMQLFAVGLMPVLPEHHPYCSSKSVHAQHTSKTTTPVTVLERQRAKESVSARWQSFSIGTYGGEDDVQVSLYRAFRNVQERERGRGKEEKNYNTHVRTRAPASIG